MSSAIGMVSASACGSSVTVSCRIVPAGTPFAIIVLGQVDDEGDNQDEGEHEQREQERREDLPNHVPVDDARHACSIIGHSPSDAADPMVKLALLWHMHQPYYEDLATGEHILPWVRLHAIKDYWGMVAMLEEFPGVRVTFNLVPSLIEQVQAFAEDRARDRHLELGLKPAADLTPDEARWMVANGFHAPVRRG